MNAKVLAMKSKDVTRQIDALTNLVAPHLGPERFASLIASAHTKTDPNFLEPTARETVAMIEAGIAEGRSADQIADDFIPPTLPIRGHEADLKMLRLLLKAKSELRL